MKEQRFRTDVLPLKNELFRLALRITLNHAEAEDVVQETMIRVWNRREQWDEIESIEAFCLTICRNLALDSKKRMDNRSETLDESFDRPDSSPTADPEQQTVRRDQLRFVRELIDQLPEKQRTCMQLRDIEAHSYKEIAAVMNITEQQVKVNIFRARQAIKQMFQNKAEHGL
jgi:RNA polymerase sigma-70 factor (ECF subfamily)